jgi:hypothetical protein
MSEVRNKFFKILSHKLANEGYEFKKTKKKFVEANAAII